MVITLSDYFGPWADHADLTPERRDNAVRLLAAVNPLLKHLEQNSIRTRHNPRTGTLVSGDVFGGFRPQSCPIGAPLSAHKTGEAVDVFDPYGSIAGYLFVRQNLLIQAKLWMEAPTATTGWCHLQIRPVKSGRTVFNP